jgi:lipoprotein-releasing system permease protein
MYKLFLCLRYLRKLLMAYFAVLAVALCVAMMLIVISVMNGFLDKIERAAKGLAGDVVISGGGYGALRHYDEFIEELKTAVPQVNAASPFIRTGGMIRLPRTDYRHIIQISGIALPGRARTTDFENGLFVQKDWEDPSFDPPVDRILQTLEAHTRETQAILQREGGDNPSDLPPEKASLCKRIGEALFRQESAARRLRRARPYQGPLRDLWSKINVLRTQVGDADSPELDDLLEELRQLEEESGLDGPANRAILGLGQNDMSFRTPQGETIRVVGPGEKVVLTLIPLGGLASAMDITPNTAGFTVVDDCSTDVHPIDSNTVYIPFHTLQRLNNMAAEYDPEDPTRIVSPARCDQIHVKMKDDFAHGEALLEARAAVRLCFEDFIRRHPDTAVRTSVLTWREYQGSFVGPIEQQRTLTVIMFSIISLVSVVLIFVILYMIVYQKTRDIGVLKAIGASSAGVSGIFLGYGASIGLVGSILGTTGGYYFVRYINEIQDAVDRWFGFRVWSREVFMFERIPSQVSVSSVVLIVIGAIVAGLLGALIPAVQAARKQPVEALRYE